MVSTGTDIYLYLVHGARLAVLKTGAELGFLLGKAHSCLAWDSRLMGYSRTVRDVGLPLAHRRLRRSISLLLIDCGVVAFDIIPLLPGPQTTSMFFPDDRG